MPSDSDFTDYYAVLQVEAGCSAKTLETAFHHFAKQFHPDNLATGDVEKFNAVTEAYRVLRKPAKREEYDQKYFPNKRNSATNAGFGLGSHEEIDQSTAVNDAEMHTRILLHLYKRRREKASDANVIQWLLQEALQCPEDQFEFHVWYLRSKGFVDITEQGGLAITVSGVDEVIASSRARSERPRLSQGEAFDGQPAGGS